MKVDYINIRLKIIEYAKPIEQQKVKSVNEEINEAIECLAEFQKIEEIPKDVKERIVQFFSLGLTQLRPAKKDEGFVFIAKESAKKLLDPGYPLLLQAYNKYGKDHRVDTLETSIIHVLMALPPKDFKPTIVFEDEND